LRGEQNQIFLLPHTHSADAKQPKNNTTLKRLAQISRIRRKNKYRNYETKMKFPLKSTQVYRFKT
jgi:hypothetical protein